MIYDNMEFFNVRELTLKDNYPGLRINRFSKEMIDEFESKLPASYSRGCEIRFKLKGGTVLVYLISVDEDGEVLVFYGDHMHGRQPLKKGVITPVVITPPPLLKTELDQLNHNSRFSKDICRIFFDTKSIVHYCGCETNGNEITPPLKEEKPKKTFAAYGSSITHGAHAIGNHNSYIQVLARLLKADVYNLGMSGSCRLENKISDFISAVACDFYLLELGVNVRGSLSTDEFKKRATYLIHKAVNTKKPVFVITIYPNIHTYYKEEPLHTAEIEFNMALREIAREIDAQNIFLIEGGDVLTDFSELSTDLIHPSDSGHMQMGCNLFHIIKGSL